MTPSEMQTLEKVPFRKLDVLIHIVAWGIILGIPFFFTGREQTPLTIWSYVRGEIVPLSFMFVFYMNYFFVVDRFLFGKKLWQFLLSNLFLIGVAMGAVHILFQILPTSENMHKPPREWTWEGIIGFLLFNIFLYLLVAGLSVAIKMTARWYETEKERRELDKNRVEAEIQNLKSQLNPHFLFNTLNNIYSLIAISPDQAQEAVHDLSKLLRYVLYESSQPMVTLDKEMDFVRNYVELMRIRLPKGVDLKIDIEADSSLVLIAPLMFITPIENAFKHGVSNSHPSFIHISIVYKDRAVVCNISNSYFPKTQESDRSGSGIGLQNLNRRLEILYAGHYSFVYGREGEVYNSTLKIDILE